MPQFDPTYFASQAFWLVIFFGVLYFFLSKTAVPRIGEVLERRQKTIDDNLAKARAFKDDSDAAIAKYEADLDAARDEAQSAIRGATEKAKAEAATKSEAKAADLEAKLAEAEKRVVEAKEKALSEVAASAAEVARHATDKLIGVKVQIKTAEKAVATVSGE